MKKRIHKLIDRIDSLERVRKLYIFLLIFSIASLLVILNYSYISTFKDVKVLYAQYTKDRIIDIKKDFLRDSVNNMINNIEQTQVEIMEVNRNRINRATKVIEEYYRSEKEDFLEKVIDYFDTGTIKEAFDIFILDRSTDKILYQNNIGHMEDTRDVYDYIDDLKKKAITYNEDDYGKYYIFYGVTKDYIKHATTESIKKRIHSDSFENDAYIWINEIVNYDGGDNYAIRLIHPNLKDTEGTYLSTKTQDIEGNYPYLTELNGIKENGEIYFTYFFKKKTRDEVAEKLTYAKLYKEYNWIIAMGVYFDDIQPYIDEISEDGDKAISKMTALVGVLSLGLILIGILIVLILEHWYYQNSNKELREKLNIDELTKAFNRRAATKKLQETFYLFKRYNNVFAVVIFDIDDFKKINDSYGHDVGDRVLRNLVEIINKSTRKTDFLCRWGGEEFLLICEGLKEEHLDSFTDKILRDIENFEYEDQGEKYHITISIGASYFNKDDEDFSSVVKRADMALYKSKKEGKNRATLDI
ncbi:diguanylate cyclase [Tissierella carlieri]|uniref:sensor domain-containing diguanylate cyclase n=1 Tax=Tissierella carlieri TaxID=689904 RepID=UPI001C10F08F|nr:sensor domain-containing diguanylate cyclase [Tissierella carlieri]MBU5310660.1 diguanylate cyclase [Tissierella carlieri]MDU5080952.1 sensor domain-containing diguanylate cyclase [Bacillota bacterium]